MRDCRWSYNHRCEFPAVSESECSTLWSVPEQHLSPEHLVPTASVHHTLVHLCFLNGKINLKICLCDQYLSKKFFECLCTHLDYWCIQMIVLPVNEVLYSLWQVYRRVWGLHWTAVRPPSCLMTRLSYPSKGENCELHSVL